MAIAYDNSSQGHTDSGTSLTFALTVGSGSGRKLWVGVFCNEDSNGITGITYNSVAMTKANESNNTVDHYMNSLWYLDDPSSGSNNVVISRTGSTEITAAASSYSGCGTGVDASTPHSSESDLGPTHDFSNTTIADNCWSVLWLGTNFNRSTTAGTSTTLRQSINNNGSGGLLDSNAAKTPAGSVTLQAVFSGNAYCSGVLASFGPPVAASTGNFSSTLLLMGAG